MRQLCLNYLNVGSAIISRKTISTFVYSLMSTPSRTLQGKVAIITGAASGIGEASARLFAANGATVIIADINDDLGLSVAASIGPTCTFKHCDVTDEAQLKSLVDFAVSTFSRLDILHSNAGVLGRRISILDIDKRDLESTLGVNVVGAAMAIKHAARAMIACGARGSIVCTASVAAGQAGHGPAGYIASKHALLGLVRAAAGELGEEGIRVNCVSPHIVAGTGMSGTTPVPEELCCAVSNLKRVKALRAEDVAEAAMFLASDAARYVSGHDLVVDGGSSVVYTALAQYKANLAVNPK